MDVFMLQYKSDASMGCKAYFAPNGHPVQTAHEVFFTLALGSDWDQQTACKCTLCCTQPREDVLSHVPCTYCHLFLHG